MADNVMLLFLDNHLDFAAQKLDDITFKKPPIDVVDKPIYRLALGMLNKFVSKEIPDEYKESFHEVMDLVVEGDYDDAGAEAVDIVKELVEDWDLLKPGVKEIVLGVLDIVKGALASLD